MSLPRYCIFDRAKCRVVSYIGDGKFEIRDKHDSLRIVHRDRVRFVA